MLTDAIIFVYILQVNISKVKNLRWLKNRQIAHSVSCARRSHTHLIPVCKIYVNVYVFIEKKNKFLRSFLSLFSLNGIWAAQWKRTIHTHTTDCECERVRAWINPVARLHATERKEEIKTETMQTLLRWLMSFFSILQIEISIWRRIYANRTRNIVYIDNYSLPAAGCANIHSPLNSLRFKCGFFFHSSHRLES